MTYADTEEQFGTLMTLKMIIVMNLTQRLA
jgi:hypothetical protein